jgi:hypothetical protein
LGLFPEDLERFAITRAMVKEPYPKQSDKPQQPGTNVVNSIIEYPADYYGYTENQNWGLVQKYKRYGYIYENF